MRKILAAALPVFLLISLSACSGGKGILCGVETDYPVMIMVNGTLYYGSASRYEGAVDETAVKTVTSYTDAVPKKDGECNFDRSLKTKYILTEQGLVVLWNGEWRLFRAEGQDVEPNAPAGKIRFDRGVIYEDNTPVIERHTFRMYVNFDME